MNPFFLAAAIIAGFASLIKGGEKLRDYETHRYENYFDDSDRIDWGSSDGVVKALERRREKDVESVGKDLSGLESLDAEEKEHYERILGVEKGVEEKTEYDEEATKDVTSLNIEKGKRVAGIAQSFDSIKDEKTLLVSSKIIMVLITEVQHINQLLIRELQQVHKIIENDSEINELLAKVIVDEIRTEKEKEALFARLEKDVDEAKLKRFMAVFEGIAIKELKQAIDNKKLGEEERRLVIRLLAELKILEKRLIREQQMLQKLYDELNNLLTAKSQLEAEVKKEEVVKILNELREFVAQEVLVARRVIADNLRLKVDIQLGRSKDKREIHYLVDEEKLSERKRKVLDRVRRVLLKKV